jgi:hypothetical protein
VLEYFVLKAGPVDTEPLVAAFIGWLKRSPAEHNGYRNGNDMARAALVDWFLKVVR